MEWWKGVLLVYLTGAGLVTCRLGWHMAFRLDEFDWRYSSPYLDFLLGALLWPLMLLRPGILVDPMPFFRSGGLLDLAELKREEERDVRENPLPRCSARIRFDTQRQDYEEGFGSFVFDSADVEACVKNRIRQNPDLADRFDGHVLAWIRNRDDTMAEPVALLKRHWKFGDIANELLRAGHGQVHCRLCGLDYSTNELVLNDDGIGPGWRFLRLMCPSGHPLLVVEWAHFYMEQKTSEEE